VEPALAELLLLSFRIIHQKSKPQTNQVTSHVGVSWGVNFFEWLIFDHVELVMPVKKNT
jgi:hypothetical protein